jgi:hypothetical protein
VMVIQESSAWLRVRIGIGVLFCALAGPLLMNRNDNAKSQYDDFTDFSIERQHFVALRPLIATVQPQVDFKSSA